MRLGVRVFSVFCWISVMVFQSFFEKLTEYEALNLLAYYLGIKLSFILFVVSFKLEKAEKMQVIGLDMLVSAGLISLFTIFTNMEFFTGWPVDTFLLIVELNAIGMVVLGFNLFEGIQHE